MKNWLFFSSKKESCKIASKELKRTILGFALTAFCSLSLNGKITGFSTPPSNGCDTTIIQIEQENTEVIFAEGEDHLWFSLSPDSTSYISITESVGNAFPDLSIASIYIGESCAGSVLSDSEVIFIDSNNYGWINHDFADSNNYFIKLERSSEENYPTAGFNIKYKNKIYCPPNPFNICNLLKNGDFTNSIDFPDDVCHWRRGSWTADIDSTYKAAYMWWEGYPQAHYESIEQDYSFV